MKECPKCKRVYTDDLFFCLDDGLPLATSRETIDNNAPTEVAYHVGNSQRTEIIPNTRPVAATQMTPQYHTVEQRPPSKMAYVAIGALALACISLAFALIVVNRDRIFPAQQSQRNTLAQIPFNSVPTASVSPATPSTNIAKTSNQATIPSAAKYDPTGKWNGQWSTDSGTMLDFELSLTESGNAGLEGQIKWTLRRTARPDKMNKIGLTAIEFVRGTFDPSTGAVKMNGYGKNDPNNVLVMVDAYKLNVSQDGRTLTGLARNGGKWNGHINLSK
jgi:hypothetical protein